MRTWVYSSEKSTSLEWHNLCAFDSCSYLLEQTTRRERPVNRTKIQNSEAFHFCGVTKAPWFPCKIMWNFYRYVNFPQFFVIASKTVLLSTKPVVQPKVEQLSFHYFLRHSMYPINCSIIWQTNRLPENNFSFDDKYWCWCIFAYSGKFKSLLCCSSFNGKYSYMHALNSLTYLPWCLHGPHPNFPLMYSV